MSWCWFRHGVKNDYECWIAIESRKELVKQKMKIFKYFPNFKKNQNHFFTKTIDFYKNASKFIHPYLFKKSAPETTSKLHKLTVSMLYRSLKPPGYILGLWKSLYTNLFYDESVIYSLIFCYIRYYTNI